MGNVSAVVFPEMSEAEESPKPNLNSSDKNGVYALKDVGMKPGERLKQNLRRGLSMYDRREMTKSNVCLASKMSSYKSPLNRDRILKASDKFLNAKKFLTNFKQPPRLQLLPPVELRDKFQ